MDFNTLRNLYIDIFHDPLVGWYDQEAQIKNVSSWIKELGSRGNFSKHSVKAFDPSKVKNFNLYKLGFGGMDKPGNYKKVNIPPRSEYNSIMQEYKVSPRNIIPYSPHHKSFARVLLNKGINAGNKVLNKMAIPYGIIEGLGLNSPAY